MYMVCTLGKDVMAMWYCDFVTLLYFYIVLNEHKASLSSCIHNLRRNNRNDNRGKGLYQSIIDIFK